MRSLGARVGLIAVSLALAFGPALPAMANIFEFEDGWVASSTNPGQYEDYNVVWREGWGNDPLAKFTINIPQPDEDQPANVGGYYMITRPGASTDTSITEATYPSCYNAPISSGTVWDLKHDLIAEVLNPGPLFRGTGAIPGAVRSYEGPFTTHVALFAKDSTITATGGFSYGLDVTPPSQVTGLKASDQHSGAPISGWLKQGRAVFTWDDKRYDSLSGTGYFEAFLDGKPYPLKSGSSVSRKVYDLREHFPGYGFDIRTLRQMTIEDLPAGKHTFQIRAVDRATNAGPLSSPVTLQIDPDIPTINVTWPTVSGQIVGASSTFKASVKDLGGVASVKFYVDNVYKAIDTSAPYERQLDLSGFAHNSSHTLKVVATDMAGRTNYGTMKFVVDKLKPTLSGVSGAPSPFYPRIREGYKDNFKVKFTTNKPGTVKMTVKDSAGRTVRTISKTVGTGASSITWNGKTSTGTVKSGTFRYTLNLKDAAGQSTTTSARSVTIKFSEVVRVSSSSVRIIQR